MNKTIIDKLSSINDELQMHKYSEIGLFSGISGNILFQYYFNDLIEDDKNKSVEDVSIANLFHVLEKQHPLPYTICDGLAGVAWLFSFLDREGFIQFDTDDIREFDNNLIDILKRDTSYIHYDFLHKHLGIAYYFACKKKYTEEIINSINSLLERILRDAENVENNQLKWNFNPKKGTPIYNISLSHGQAAIVALMTKLKQNKFQNEKIEFIAKGAINYILAQEIDKNIYGSYFPSLAKESMEQISGSRLGWCYGDLGIAVILWNASNVFGDEDLKAKAEEILFYSASMRRTLEENGILDACLCHGTTGVALIFYRMWQNTKREIFKEAADYWFEETLKQATFEEGVAGFCTWDSREIGYMKNYSLLEGVVGVGLFLIAYISQSETKWDECLMLS